MTDVVGLELTRDVVRAVALGGWRARPGATAEVEWDPTAPDAAVARLREQLGATRRLALAVGLAFLHPKRVQLPPVPAPARRAMLALEPDRYFPVEGPVEVALVGEDGLAFAADADVLERWLSAFEQWAPVESMEPAPVAAARALPPEIEGTFELSAGGAEHGAIEIRGGALLAARRVPNGADAPPARPLPEVAGLAPELGVAFGAARGVDATLDATLLPEGRAARTRYRRLGRLAGAAAVCALATVAALWALDRSRARTLSRLDDEIARAEQAAAPAIALRDSLGVLDLEAAALGDLDAIRPDPLPVLAALGERLPRDATVLSLRSTGVDWQIDGTAEDAAALVPLLDRDERFQDVRVLAASSRFREGARTYETFSIAFRALPASD